MPTTAGPAISRESKVVIRNDAVTVVLKNGFVELIQARVPGREEKNAPLHFDSLRQLEEFLKQAQDVFAAAAKELGWGAEG